MAGGDIPVYESVARVPEGPQATISPISYPQADSSAIGDAASKLGAAGVEFSLRLAHAQSETDEAAAKTAYLEGVGKLRDTYARSEDYRNAPDIFEKENLKLKREILAPIKDPAQRQKLDLYFTLHGAAAARDVKTKALANEGDDNIAGLNERSADYVRRIAAATTPVERQALIDSFNEDVDSQAAAGWITRQAAQQRKITTRATVDDADALALIRMNPRQAMEELQNPERFTGLGPIQRENLVNQAKAQQDQLAAAEVQNIARRDPVRAFGIVGRVGAVSEADGVFDRGIIPIESGGKPDVVSSAGAVGLSQLMLGTARDNAKAMGLNDVASLGDDELRKRLIDDPRLNRSIGLNYWRTLVDRYDGRIYAAAAAYNAGPGNDRKPRADAWVAEAERRYGPNFSPAELASVIPIDETKNYVLKLAKTLGAPAGGSGLSPAASFHASSAVSAAVNQQNTERVSAIKAVAAIAREGDDPAAIFKSGYDIDPSRYAGWKQAQLDAAGHGDMTAAKAVRDAEFQRELLPFRQQALATPPAKLEALVESERARLTNSPNVSIDDKNRLDVAEETLKSVKRNREDNIIGLAEQGRFVPPDQQVTIDPKADPGTQGFARALALRGAQANAAAKFYGGKAIALKPLELAGLKQRFDDAQPDEQFRIIQSFGRHLEGQAYTDTVRAVMGGGENAEVVGRIARERPELAREILIGTKLLASKEIGDKATQIKPALSSALGGLVYPNADMQNDVVTAALALYTARRGAGGLYDATDAAAIEKSIEDVTGPIVKRNGRKTPIAPEIPPRNFHDALDHLSDRELTLMGGAYDRNGRPMSAADISARAQLVPLAPGSPRYVVQMPTPDGKGAHISTYEGAPLVFDMRTVARSVENRLGPWQSRVTKGSGRFVVETPATRQDAEAGGP